MNAEIAAYKAFKRIRGHDFFKKRAFFGQTNDIFKSENRFFRQMFGHFDKNVLLLRHLTTKTNENVTFCMPFGQQP
ncbi:MAG: hypothetical protein J5545_05400 [Bacteroidaceae bacterium]|nr:hypothetical protein [Bacteroidaceae bacterium]